jgi:hypothetical protein
LDESIGRYFRMDGRVAEGRYRPGGHGGTVEKRALAWEVHDGRLFECFHLRSKIVGWALPGFFGPR